MKFNLSIPISPLKNQNGAVLFTSLILLVVLTILGISTIEVTKLETKMASNNIELNKSFQIAEAGLTRVGQNIGDFYNSIGSDDFVYNPSGIAAIEIKDATVKYRTDVGIKKVGKYEVISSGDTGDYYYFYHVKSINYFIDYQAKQVKENKIHQIDSTIRIELPSSDIFETNY
ncbi:MAG: hypothetical protein KAH84_02700 [Thiomargarita sp.]|nr:hypothetical protein [Thiomargarita sp.]